MSTDYHYGAFGGTFYGDWDDEKVYDAIGFDAPWNGWATPVVTREVLEQLIADSPAYRVRFDADGVATVERDRNMDSGYEPVPDVRDWDDYATLRPTTPSGDVRAYHLSTLGWTFTEADESDMMLMVATIRDAVRLGLEGESIAAVELLISRFPKLTKDLT